MPHQSEKKSLLIILSVFLFVITMTYVVVLFARGYQISFNQGNPSLKVTGLLSATSKPKGAPVYINDRLISATDDTINLPPAEYIVRILKDGYLPWEKKIQIKPEVVFQTDTQLFRSVPDIKPLTQTGAINPIVSPDGSIVVYAIASASASLNNGLYLIELADSPIPLYQNLPKKIVSNLPGIDWSKYIFTFSPDSRSLLATNQRVNINYLLNLDSTINPNNLYDITPRLSLIQTEWATQTKNLIQNRLAKIPMEIKSFISTESAKSVVLSHSEDKILYLANSDGDLPQQIITPPPAQSTQIQTRHLTKGNYYIYNLKDDTNFLVGPSDTIHQPLWLNNSSNIVYLYNQEVKTVEFDGTNGYTLYAGNIDKSILATWFDGSRIVILNSPYPTAPFNLYSVTIR